MSGCIYLPNLYIFLINVMSSRCVGIFFPTRCVFYLNPRSFFYLTSRVVSNGRGVLKRAPSLPSFGFCLGIASNTSGWEETKAQCDNVQEASTVSRFKMLTFRHRASCILGQAFHCSLENAFYIFNQQIYFIIWYLLDRASLI